MYLTSKLLSQNLSIKIPIFSTFVARFMQFNSSVSQVPSLIVPLHLCSLCNDTEQQGNTNHQNFPKCHLFVISFDQHTCNNTNNYVNENPFFKCQTNSRGYKHSFSFYKKKKTLDIVLLKFKQMKRERFWTWLKFSKFFQCMLC